jgi:hypothetical protein
MQDHHTATLADSRKFQGDSVSSQYYSAWFSTVGKVTVIKLQIQIYKVTNPNPFTNPDQVTNPDPYMNLDLVTNPDLDTTPPPPRSLLLFMVRFFILTVKLEAES